MSTVPLKTLTGFHRREGWLGRGLEPEWSAALPKDVEVEDSRMPKSELRDRVRRTDMPTL